MEKTIHHPTDSRLLTDSVHVLGRSLSRAKALLSARTDLGKEIFRNRQRSAKRAARKIAGLSRRGREQLKPHYQRLLQTTKATIRQAERVLAELEDQLVDEGHNLIETMRTFLPRAQVRNASPIRAAALVLARPTIPCWRRRPDQRH